MTFEKFTAKARRVVVMAQEQARMLKHDSIDTEHLLLGLLGVPDGTAAKVLNQLGLDQQTAQADVVAVVKPGTSQRNGHIPFTPRAKKVLELALRESIQLHHDYVGTEHVLLALVREGAGIGATVLAQRIEPIGKIRAAVLASVSESPEVADGPWPAGTPATRDTVSTASELAGGAPVGSHHLLEAMLRTENSMAARVLRELGVDPDAVAAKIDELDPETTSDANPAESAARRMEIRLVDGEVHLILRDENTVAAATKVTELADGPVQGVGPVAGMFVPLWQSTNQLLQQLQRVLEPDNEDGEGGSATGRAAKLVRAARLLRRRA